MSADQYLARRDAVALDEVSLGYRTVRLLTAAELPGAQAGYAGSGWSGDWLVIALEDQLGDPIFTELTVEGFPIYTAAHGEGRWNPVQIADSFDGFAMALAAVADASTGREHPVGSEENPLPSVEREQILARISEANPASDPEFWESWLDA